MPNLPLFTSIPARISRRTPDGQEAGPAWTRACIDSWKNAGYDVVSVNAVSEAAQVRQAYPGVEVVEVQRDGSVRNGRPLVYVSDMLALMAASGHASVAIANADVLCLADAAAMLRGWQPQGFAYSNRLDIDDRSGAGARQHGGMDYLIVNTPHLEGLAAPDFLFGTPWWDYWLPLALMSRGIPGTRLSLNGLPVIAHLAHTERWNSADFMGNYTLFAHAMAVQAAIAPGATLGLYIDVARSTSDTIHRLNPVTELPCATHRQAA